MVAGRREEPPPEEHPRWTGAQGEGQASRGCVPLPQDRCGTRRGEDSTANRARGPEGGPGTRQPQEAWKWPGLSRGKSHHAP